MIPNRELGKSLHSLWLTVWVLSMISNLKLSQAVWFVVQNLRWCCLNPPEHSLEWKLWEVYRGHGALAAAKWVPNPSNQEKNFNATASWSWFGLFRGGWRCNLDNQHVRSCTDETCEEFGSYKTNRFTDKLEGDPLSSRHLGMRHLFV